MLCGTQKQDFSRMIQAVEGLDTQEEIIIQGGHNPYQSHRMKVHGFFSEEELERLYAQADYVITHAGAGSMLKAIKKGKKTIAFPRLKKYGEHVNDHQLELAEKFEDLGYLLVCRDGDDLGHVFERLKGFQPKAYGLKGDMVELIDGQLDRIIGR
ncbi:MAG: hypothetical protein FWF59_12295 [Turicibacter sp.]|nr:hypothetical protein [Turicibacter sp.]